jgi:hypothetical protein
MRLKKRTKLKKNNGGNKLLFKNWSEKTILVAQ